MLLVLHGHVQGNTVANKIMTKRKLSVLLLGSGAAILGLGLAGCTSGVRSMHASAFVVPRPPSLKKPAVSDSPAAGHSAPHGSAAGSLPLSTGGGSTTATGGGYANSLGSDLSPVQAARPLPPGEKLSVAALLGSVDGRPIFVQTIFNMVDSDLKREAADSRNLQYFEQQAMGTLARAIRSKVDTMLLLTQARRRLTSDQKKQVAAYVRVREAKLLAQYMGSQERANRALKRQGTSLDRRLEKIRNKATLELFINHTISPRIVVTRRDMIRYYRRHISKFTRHTSVSLYTITYPIARQLPRNPDDPTHTEPIRHPTPAQLHEAQVKAMAYCLHLEDEIRHGANFAFLAEDNSHDYAAANGGHVPNVRPSELSNQKLARLIESLHAHQMAPPMLLKNPVNPARDSIIIVKVGRVVHHQVLPFDAVEAKIRLTLSNRQYQKLIRAYYHSLYGHQSVGAMEKMAKTALAVAVAKYWHHS